MHMEVKVKEKKNLLFFIADQLRGDSLGVFNNQEVKNPNND